MRSICSALLLCALVGCESFVAYEPGPARLLDLTASCSPEEGLRGLLGVVQRLGYPPEPLPTGATARWTAPDGSVVDATDPGDTSPFSVELRVPGPLASGQTYQLELNAPGFPAATALCTLPLPATDLRADILGPADLDGRIPIQVSFLDRRGPHAYWLNVTAVADADTFRTELRYSSSHPALTEANFWATIQAGGSMRSVPGLMRDVLFEGETFSTVLRVDTTARSFRQRRFENFGVELVTMPRESYSYWGIRLGTIPQTPFGDPLPSPSNVEGGAGFLEVEVRQSVPLPL